MRLRVLHRFDWFGGTSAERELLDACLTAALARREQCLADQEEPRFLHPARSALILMDDAEVTDAVTLAAAALVDSDYPELAPASSVLSRLPAPAVRLAAAVPRPALTGEQLIEELVTAGAAERLIACAERLDLARHAHMLPGFDADRWLHEVKSIYLPLAGRTHPMLAHRFQRWVSARERKEQRRRRD